MALTLKSGKTVQDVYGNEYPAAYLVVDSIKLDKRQNFVEYTIEMYKDQESREAGKSPFISVTTQIKSKDIFEQYFPVDGENPFKQAYLYLKSLETEPGVKQYEDWKDLI